MTRRHIGLQTENIRESDVQDQEVDDCGTNDNDGGEDISASFLGCRHTDDETQFWTTYTKESGEFDKELLEKWNKSLDVLLIFAGLFSAVNTAFIIESYKSLQPDPSEITNILLRLLLIHRNDGETFSLDGLSFLSQKSSTAIPVNSMFFASLSCSLLAAFGAVTAKQWLTEYSNVGHMLPPHEQGRRRQQKYDGMTTWHFWLLMELMPILLQLSLFLFLIGIVHFLWPLSGQVTAVVVGIVLLGLMAYFITVVIAITVPSSPFQTPLSKHARIIIFGCANLLSNCTPDIHQLQLVQGIKHIPFALTTLRSKVLLHLAQFWSWCHALSGIPKWRTHGLQWRHSLGGVGDGKSWDSRMVTNAQCVLWLLEQAEHPDVTFNALHTILTLPSDLLLTLFHQREGLLERLLKLHLSYLPTVSQGARASQRTWPSEALLTGAALCHVLKARNVDDYSFSSHFLPLYERWIVHSDNLMIPKLLSRVSTNRSHYLTEFPALLRQISPLMVAQVSIPLTDTRHTSLGASVVTNICPLKVLLDALTYSARRQRPWHGSSKSSEDILMALHTILETAPPAEVVSHIAVAVAAIQWEERDRRSSVWSYPSGDDQDTFESLFRKGVNAVDKSAIVSQNVALALSLIDVTSSPTMPKICELLLSLTENTFLTSPTPELLRIDVAQCLLRLSRHMPHLKQTGHRALRLLQRCPPSNNSSLSNDVYEEAIPILLDHAFSELPDLHDSADLLDVSYFMNWLAISHDYEPFLRVTVQSGALNRHHAAIVQLCRIISKQSPPELPTEFMRKILCYHDASENQVPGLVSVQMELLVLVLTASELDTLPDVLYHSAREFFNTMVERDGLQWPPYFIAAEIIAPGSAGRTCSNRVEADAFIVGG
ncbi:hypothetical protein FRC02_011923, partial [Tulasnella sp. 418]